MTIKERKNEGEMISPGSIPGDQKKKQKDKKSLLIRRSSKL